MNNELMRGNNTLRPVACGRDKTDYDMLLDANIDLGCMITERLNNLESRLTHVLVSTGPGYADETSKGMLHNAQILAILDGQNDTLRSILHRLDDLISRCVL